MNNFIIFDRDGVLLTSWGRGRYEYLSERVYKATWATIPHIIIFNNDDTIWEFTNQQ